MQSFCGHGEDEKGCDKDPEDIILEKFHGVFTK